MRLGPRLPPAALCLDSVPGPSCRVHASMWRLLSAGAAPCLAIWVACVAVSYPVDDIVRTDHRSQKGTAGHDVSAHASAADPDAHQGPVASSQPCFLGPDSVHR